MEMDLSSPAPTSTPPPPPPRPLQTPNLLIPKPSLSGSDTDTEAPPLPPPPHPPLQAHLQKSLSLSNGGSFSRRRHHHHHHHPPPGDMVVSYRECLKNHAASMGGLALDGCGEFMPAPNASPLDPTSLKCAACGCHRNFHRRDPSGGHGHQQQQHLPLPALQWTTHLHHNNNSSSPSPGQTSSGGGPSPSPSSPAASPTPHHSIYPSAPHMLLALSSAGGGGPLYPDDLNPHLSHHDGSGGRNQAVQSANLGEMGSLSSPGGRKRARTKFTPEQKVRMQDFAEKLGWKMLRGNDDKIVEDFCSQVGVRRNVFKVWMHNNKHRKDKASNGNNNSNNNSGGGGGNGNIGHHGHGHFDDGDGDDDDDEDDDGNEHVVSVKYDLNGTFSGGHHGNYEGRVRFDTNIFESKVHVHGPSAAAAGSSPSV